MRSCSGSPSWTSCSGARPPRRSGFPTRTSSNPASSSFRAPFAQSIRRPDASRPTPASSTDILVVALGADLDPATSARIEGGRPRVLYGRRRICGTRRARSVRGRSRDHRRAVDAVQMPAGAERDSAAAPRAPGGERPSRQLGDLAGDGFRAADPPSPAASAALLDAFADRGIKWHPSREVYEADPARNVAHLRDGGEMPYDLFLAVPVHRLRA